MESLTEVFLLEAADQLQALEDALLQVERDPGERAGVHAAFRAAHTVKGSSGMAGAHAVSRFTHAVENALDRMRDGRLAVAPALITLLLRSADHMRSLVDAFAQGQEPSQSLLAEGESLTDQLHPWLEDSGDEAVPAATADLAGHESLAPGDAAEGTWHISLRLGQEIFQRGVDPLRLLACLGLIGDLVRVVTIDHALPSFEELDPELCHLGFEIDLRGTFDAAQIEDAFAFVRGDCDLAILPPGATRDAYRAVAESRPEGADALMALWARHGVLPEDDAPIQGLAQDTQAATPGQAGADAISSGLASEPTAAAPRARTARDQLRVDADKLDRLMDLVGELVIAGAAASTLAQRRRDTSLIEALGVVSRRIEELRESAMQMRMVQIGATFNRFQRVVRDVSRDLGKDIELVITGGETELDKSVVEQIGDPLMHLVRNCIDHGIEPAEQRLAHGKPPRGRLTLSARHEAGGITVEVRDDGAGLDTKRILAKAIERQLLPPGAQPSDAEVHRLIFEPGFSTAHQVTQLSGRGVGMDVVRRNVHALRGSVDVDSRPGAGCTFTIRLPLTLAIIDGFRVGVGDAQFVIPLEMVGECIRLSEREGGCDYMTLHGELLPYVRLAELFGVAIGEGRRADNVVVVHHAGRKIGLVVERLFGEVQAVVKPMGPLFDGIPGLAGSILLGGGEIALFLDVPTLLRGVDEGLHAQRERAALAS